MQISSNFHILYFSNFFFNLSKIEFKVDNYTKLKLAPKSAFFVQNANQCPNFAFFEQKRELTPKFHVTAQKCELVPKIYICMRSLFPQDSLVKICIF